MMHLTLHYGGDQMPYRGLRWFVLCLLVSLTCFGISTRFVSAAVCPKGPCVTTTDVIDGQITAPDLAIGSVSSATVADGSLTGADIQNGSIGGDDLASGAVSASHLSPGAVTGAAVADGTLTGEDLQDGSVGSADLATGAVVSRTIAPEAVGSVEIRDGSVAASDVGFAFAGSAAPGGPASDVACAGCISRSELDFTVAGVPAHRVVVATSGGDYSSISDALAAINPSPSDPYVIDVMPGTYSETITMKSYVHLRGAGRDVTTLWAPSIYSTVIFVSSLSNVEISGLTIFGGGHAIVAQSSSPTIRDNIFYFNQDGITIYGDYGASGSPIIENNLIRENRGYGISSENSPATIRGNTIVKNGETGIVTYFSAATISGNIVSENRDGIWSSGTFPAPTIRENTISANQGFGLYLYAPATVVHNTVTGNQAVDVLSGEGTANISFNVYDTIGGVTGTGRGQFNVNSSGGLAPAP